MKEINQFSRNKINRVLELGVNIDHVATFERLEKLLSQILYGLPLKLI